MDRIETIKIELTFAEGPNKFCDSPEARPTFEGKSSAELYEAANSAIAHFCIWQIPRGSEGYWKMDFKLTFADNVTYSGRLDLSRDLRDANLQKHVLDFAGFHSGTRRPDHITPERYAEYMRTHQKAIPEYLELLERYDVCVGVR